ncbi:hypothetical protein BJX66DRAFT_350308 [Aspergillus keveii]|uniref:FAD-binding domain-containing protein n=1 Tax=Aspergillus keveii TaxID=714993 RepID=A0ABR4FI08_9EURO
MGRPKVLIIGGSVTGLTLAAIFERYGIDYALLEKHADVTPALGASIGLLAHGSRVLDQLGCFEELLPFGNGIENMDMYDPDGKKMGCHKNLGTYMESIVAKIEHHDGGVGIETRDGRIFTGDFVVGADGVHSKTRGEMWRLLKADGDDLTVDRNAIKSTHSCIFGISHGLTQVQSTDAWRTCRQDRHYLISGAPNGLTFWFCFFKNRKHASTWDALPYSEEEKEQIATEFSTDRTRPDVTFADLYRTSTSVGVVPMEEFVLNRYYYKRILLLGDSVHKMHPITGQGGNAAIEDCAYLANRLQDLLRRGQTPTYSQLQDIFHEVQEERRPRTEYLTKGAHGLARLESFGTPILKQVMLYIFPRVPCENILAGLAESMTQGKSLMYLPLPQRAKRLTPYDDEVTVTPKRRSALSSYSWILLFLLAGSLRYLLALDPTNNSNIASLAESDTWQHYEGRTYFYISAIWTLESYRSALSLGPLLTPIPWMLLAQYIGWDVAVSLYFSLWILGTRYRGFYHPWPRAIPLAAAKALLIAMPVALWGSGVFQDIAPGIITLDSRAPPYIVLPVLASLLGYFFKRDSTGWVPALQWGNRDIIYTSQFFYVSLIDTGISHLNLVVDNLIPAIRAEIGSLTEHVVGFGAVTLLIVLWLLFTAWDLRRVNILNWSLARAALCIAVGFALVGPGGTLIAAWWVREKAWEKSRQRISQARYAEPDRQIE